MKITLLYQDEALVIVDKPAQLLSVPGRGPDKQDSVYTQIQALYPDARVVHRLDCATSGLMVIALGIDSQRHLNRQFHDRQVKKRYLADIHGQLQPPQGTVDQPLRCDWPNRPRQIIDREAGKAAQTHYQLIQHQARHSRVALTPITGRSHQLRVHMQYLGHPILGDRLYAPQDDPHPRLHLHAEFLAFTHPFSGEPVSYTCPCPF